MVNRLWLWLLMAMVCVACKEQTELPQMEHENLERVKIAVILPFEELGTDWHRVLDWAQETVAQGSGTIVPEYEIYDECSIDI